MIDFGVPREVRDLETRVGLTPAGVLALTQAGHRVYLEREAGVGAGFTDEDYRRAGGNIVYSAAELYGRAEVVVKVARPTAVEHAHFRPNQTIFAFMHLPVASADLLEALQVREITAVAYEMITATDGSHPILLPASEIAGRMVPIIAGQWLRSDQRPTGGHGLGILLSGVPGVPSATVVIIGGGVLGRNAARACVGLGAEVTILDTDLRKLQQADEQFDGRVHTMFANTFNLERAARFADVLVGAVLVSGQRSPILISRSIVRQMRPGSVIIDFAIDEGGCIETSRPTTLRDPVYVAEQVIHHCVPNVTAAYARTTSYALTNALLPFLLLLGDWGVETALKTRPGLGDGVNVYRGKITNEAVAKALALGGEA